MTQKSRSSNNYEVNQISTLNHMLKFERYFSRSLVGGC